MNDRYEIACDVMYHMNWLQHHGRQLRKALRGEVLSDDYYHKLVRLITDLEEAAKAGKPRVPMAAE